MSFMDSQNISTDTGFGKLRPSSNITHCAQPGIPRKRRVPGNPAFDGITVVGWDILHQAGSSFHPPSFGVNDESQ